MRPTLSWCRAWLCCVLLAGCPSGDDDSCSEADSCAPDAGAEGEEMRCASGADRCEQGCFVLDSDPEHCGACEHACGGEESCVSGECVAALDGSALEDDAGQTGPAMDGSAALDGSSTRDAAADGGARDARSDARAVTCSAPYTACDGECVDLTHYQAHCGTCGHACGSAEICRASQCVSTADDCRYGKECTGLTFCNSQTGLCEPGCDRDGQCGTGNRCELSTRSCCANESDAQYCANRGFNCGMVTGADACGRARSVDCGRCVAPETCGGSAMSNVCGCTATSWTDVEFCENAGKTCGTITTPDNCGNARTASCGSCASPFTCEAKGSANVCETASCDADALHAASASATWPTITKPIPGSVYEVTRYTVLDSQTCLLWQKRAGSSVYSYAQAVTYCQQLSLGGYATGWRLPTRVELESLRDTTQSDPSMNHTAFLDESSSYFWSSTLINTSRYVVGMHNGNDQTITRGEDFREQVRCVR